MKLGYYTGKVFIIFLCEALRKFKHHATVPYAELLFYAHIIADKVGVDCRRARNIHVSASNFSLSPLVR